MDLFGGGVDTLVGEGVYAVGDEFTAVHILLPEKYQSANFAVESGGDYETVFAFIALEEEVGSQSRPRRGQINEICGEVLGGHVPVVDPH